MADFLGPIAIPDAPVIGDFPIRPDYGSGIEITDRVVVHLTDTPGLRTEQRFYIGDGARRFRVRKFQLACEEYDDLKAHWQEAQGVHAQFYYDHPVSKSSTERVLVRYDETQLAIDLLAGLITSEVGIVLAEVPTAAASVAVDPEPLERFPDALLTAELLHDIQRPIPLITIQPRGEKEPGVPQDPLYLSDRRISITGLTGGDRLYLPRLLEWSGISQSLGENSDSARFVFGNADECWFDYCNAVALSRARVDFCLVFAKYESEDPTAGTGVLLKLWSGYLQTQGFRGQDDGLEITAFDGVYELNMAYPSRMVSRTCWKKFADGVWCPYSETHLNPDTGAPALDPAGNPFTFCPKDYEACKERGMLLHFGGIRAPAQTVRIKSDTIKIHGRSEISSVTVASDTIYQRPVPEIYMDTRKVESVTGEDDDMVVTWSEDGFPMPVVAEVALGVDEDEYYSAIGILSEGPIQSVHADLLKHKLDDKAPHDPEKSGGFRSPPGRDPAASSYDFFATNISPWNWPVSAKDATPALPAGTPYPPGSTFAAGTAFCEIRRTDDKGLQLYKVSDRKMVITVTGGMGGWFWSGDAEAGYTRDWKFPLTNPVWILINIYLRAVGLRADLAHTDAISSETMLEHFDAQAAIDSAKICDKIVDVLVPENSGIKEVQFPFRAMFREQKALRDWMQEILNCCLGFYTFVAGKLRIGIRVNSSVEAGGTFTQANVLRRSVNAEFVEPSFNHLTAQFGDAEFEWQLNNAQWYDIDHAEFLGSPNNPKYLMSNMTLIGASNKSQAQRIVRTRLREELGGLTREQQQNARHMALKTTVMALSVYPGEICSMTHPKLPNEDHRVEFRVTRWQLNPDWSIDIEGTSTCDDMYDLVKGPKPADAQAEPVPAERAPSAQGVAWLPNEIAPFANDPYWPASELTFKVWQDATLEAEGTYSGIVYVQGEQPINASITNAVSPAIRNIKTFDVDGFLPDGTPDVVPDHDDHTGQTYYFVVAQRDGEPDGQYGPTSNYVAVWVPKGTDTNRITLGPIQKKTDLPGYGLWAGTNIRVMSQQISDNDTPLPAAIEFSGPLQLRTRGAPNSQIAKIRIKAREVWHSGVAGIQVQRIEAPNKIFTSELHGSDDPWFGEYLSVVSDASDLSAPLWNFQIIDFDNGGLDPLAACFTVYPDCVTEGDPDNSVAEGDVMIIRSRATSATKNTITNTLWANDVAESQFGAGEGLHEQEETGLTIMVIAGKGKGQIREITDNDHLTHTVTPDWEVIPDTTTVYIVTLSDWPYRSETVVKNIALENRRIYIGTRIANSMDHVLLVGGFAVDTAGNETREDLACYREIYVYGEPYQVRTTMLPEEDIALHDHTLRVDTTDGDVTVNLPWLKDVFGRKFLVVNDGTGAAPGRAIIQTVHDDEFQSGEEEVILENVGDWAEFVAGGDREKTMIPPEDLPTPVLTSHSVWGRYGRARQRMRQMPHLKPPNRRGQI
jgi:hypothetical protein